MEYLYSARPTPYSIQNGKPVAEDPTPYVGINRFHMGENTLPVNSDYADMARLITLYTMALERNGLNATGELNRIINRGSGDRWVLPSINQNDYQHMMQYVANQRRRYNPNGTLYSSNKGHYYTNPAGDFRVGEHYIEPHEIKQQHGVPIPKMIQPVADNNMLQGIMNTLEQARYLR